MSAGEHESFIKTPKQLITVVVLSFVVPVLLIIMLAQLATGGLRGAASGDAADANKRLQPVAVVAVGGGAAAAAAPKSGEQVFSANCAACHGANSAVPGSPKLGDKATWAKLAREGLDHLTENAIKGIRAMPARGGNPDLLDIEIARAIVHMANQSGANLKVPAAPEQRAGTEAAVAQPASPAAPDPSPVPPTAPASVAMAASAAPVAATPAATKGDKGEAVYNAACMACHTTGAANAPKLGDQAAWAARSKQGLEALHTAAIKGKGAMPAKGGNASLADADVKAAVDYILARSK